VKHSQNIDCPIAHAAPRDLLSGDAATVPRGKPAKTIHFR